MGGKRAFVGCWFPDDAISKVGIKNLFELSIYHNLPLTFIEIGPSALIQRCYQAQLVAG